MNNQNINNYGNNGGDGINNGGGGPCGACKFLRRKCVSDCIFAPYFDSDQGAAHFAAVHRVFGASNVSKLLNQVPTDKRVDTVLTTCFEAQARLKDPVYGCVGLIIALQQQVVHLQTEFSRYVHAHMATNNMSVPPPFPPQQMLIPPAQLSVADMATVTSTQSAYDLTYLLDPMNQPSWTMPAQMDCRQFLGTTPPRTSAAESSAVQDFISGDLQDLAREFLERHARGSSDGAGGSDNN